MRERKRDIGEKGAREGRDGVRAGTATIPAISPPTTIALISLAQGVVFILAGTVSALWVYSAAEHNGESRRDNCRVKVKRG